VVSSYAMPRERDHADRHPPVERPRIPSTNAGSSLGMSSNGRSYTVEGAQPPREPGGGRGVGVAGRLLTENKGGTDWSSATWLSFIPRAAGARPEQSLGTEAHDLCPTFLPLAEPERRGPGS
jgi:hypothetical protein